MAITGSCHCQKITFTIEGELPEKLTRCTCSFCAKRGLLHAYFQPAQLAVKAEPGADGVYRWNTRQVAHHFCTHCGCGVYSDSPEFGPDGSWDGTTRRICANARLFDDFDAAEAPATVLDGKHLW